MKKIIYFILAIISLYFLSCTDEDGGYTYNDIGDITIENMEKSYRVFTTLPPFEGDILNISPVIQSNYEETEFEYFWYIIDKSKEGIWDPNLADEDRYEAELISRDKNLSYKIDLPVGDYYLVFKAVSKKDGYGNSKMSSMSVVSEYSTGFYILKENSQGNCELDLLTWNEKVGSDYFTENALSVRGVTIHGAPRALSIAYWLPYRIDEIQMKTHAICVTTETNDMKMLASSDLSVVKDLTNAFYSAPEGDFEPYITTRGIFCLHQFSNKGVSSYYPFDISDGIQVGKFPAPVGSGASKFVVGTGFYSYYWNNTTHGINSVDFNGGVSLLKGDTIPTNKLKDLSDNLKIKEEVVDDEVIRYRYRYKSDGLLDLTCIAIGYCTYGGSNIYLLLENDEKDRYLYIIGSSVNNVIPLDKDLNLAQSNIISTNGLNANIMYCVNNNKLYSHVMDYSNTISEQREKELVLRGIAENEKITYVTNQYWVGGNEEDENFDYLVVVTQDGDNYTLRLYEHIGGVPIDNPVKTVKGTGKLKSVKFIAPNYDSGDYPIAD